MYVIPLMELTKIEGRLLERVADIVEATLPHSTCCQLCNINGCQSGKLISLIQNISSTIMLLVFEGRKNSEQDLYSVLSPITWCCRVFGIFPLWLKSPAGKKKYSTSYVLMIYAVMILALSITRLFTWMEHVRNKIPEYSISLIAVLFSMFFHIPWHGGHWVHTISITTLHMELALQTCSIGVMIITAVINRDRFADAIDTLSSQDTTLRKLGSKLDYARDLKRTYIRLGINISVMLVVCTYDCIFQFNFNVRYPLIWAGWIFPNVVRILSTLLFSDVLFALRQRFEALNEHLRKMIEETQRLSFEPDIGAGRLCSLARMHEALCEAAVNVNKTFGFNLIIGAVCALKMLTTSLLHMIQEINSPVDISWTQVVGFLNWGVIGSAHIVYLVTVCSLTQKQASLTSKLIHKFQIDEGPTPFNTMVRSFSLQLYHNVGEFTAVGVFPLDATLLQTIAVVVTTFLTIVLQFEALEASEV